MAAKRDRGYLVELHDLWQMPLLPLLQQGPQSPLPRQMIIDGNYGFPRLDSLS